MAAAANVSIAVYLLISFFLQASAKPETTSFDFPRFYPLPSSISFQGHGYVSRGSLELNKNRSFSYGRAVYANPVRLWDSKSGNVASFSSSFSFSVFREPNGTLYADGMAFFLAPVRYGLADNTTGGELTLFTSYLDSHPAKAPVLAVEFDTYRNEWDAGVPHIGINVGYIDSERALDWDPFRGRSNFSATAEITYDPASSRLRASFGQSDFYNREISVALSLRDLLPEMVTIGFAGGTGQFFERHVIHSWSFSSSLEIPEDEPSPNGKKKKSAAIAAGVAGSVGLAILVILLAWVFARRRRATPRLRGIDEKELDGGKGPKSFPYSELAHATKNFAPEQKLGKGGFGDVYKGHLRDPEMEVAVKRVARDSRQGQKEYASEVKVISRVRHRNLVKLVGWCHERGELLLVYEFMPNGSLDAHLYGDGKPLPWEMRYSIVKGVASALLYLHEEWEQCVVHRDVKASNVMLDENFNAKLGDFGLARLVEHGRGVETSAVAGTMGYLAPETATAGRASKESDVYSFGVLALEIACGRKPVDQLQKDGYHSLVERVWDLYGKGLFLEAADPRLTGEFDKGEMERLLIVGLWCAHPNYQERPSMAQVIGVLVFDVALPCLPLQPPAPSYRGFSFANSEVGMAHGWSSTSASGFSGSENSSSTVLGTSGSLQQAHGKGIGEV